MLAVIFCIIIGYAIGTLPFALLYSKLVYGEDIRKLGSGNPGATNIKRIYGLKAGLLVLLLDALKGFIPVVLISKLGFSFQDEFMFSLAIGLGTILGHIFNVFLGFKGGKGIATSLGVLLALYPIVTIYLVLAFVLIVYISKYISLGSISVALVHPIVLWILGYENIYYFIFSVSLAFLVVFTHRENLKRLLNKTENKFTLK